MNEREKAFFGEIQLFCERGRNLFSNLFDSIEKFATYEEARFSALTSRAASSSGSDEDDKLVITLSDQSTGAIARWDLLADNNEIKSDGALFTEVKKEMPCQFSDGSFRVATKGGRLQYRFSYKGQQISVYGATKQECWDKRFEFMMHPRKKQKPKMSFADWAEQWLETYKEGTIESAYMKSLRSNLKNYIYPVIGKKDLKAIETLELQTLLQSISSDNVRTKCAALLSDCLRTAKVCGLIPSNPYDGVKIKRYQQPELGALTHEQQKQLLQYIDTNMPGSILSDYIRVLLFTGMRQSELNALRPDNVDFDNMQIRIEAAYKRDTKEFGKTKTRRGKRIVPMARPLAEILYRYCACAGSDRLFYNSANYARKISDIFRKLDMPFAGHILRHTFVTNAYELDFPQYLVQRWVGHAGFEEDNSYLALRRASEFCETEVTEYMYLLKKSTVFSQDKKE